MTVRQAAGLEQVGPEIAAGVLPDQAGGVGDLRVARLLLYGA
jgi:hypothetical protein